MKRKFSFGIVVLMILAACLFVSCNSEVSTASQANDGKLVYATFDQMSKAIRPSSSSMTVSYELYNIDDLYWVYTATKTDGAGTTGQTDGARVPGNDQYKGLGGAIGPFSKGTWTFTVEGYLYTGSSTETMNPTVAQLREGDDFNIIYVGTADGVVLNVTNDAENPETIDITVYLQTQGGTGTLKIAANSKFFWAASGEGGSALTDLKLKVYDGDTPKQTIALTGHASDPSVPGDAVYYSNSEDTSIDGLASGDHVFKVQVVRTVNDVDQVFFEGTVNAKIYAGITTALDTQAIEGLFTYAQFNGTIDDSAVVVVATDHEVVSDAGNVSFETNYTPASGINPSAEKTTVAIESDVITAATYDLGVETSNIIAAGSKFSVASDSTAVASVDLTLTKTDGAGTTTVSDFEGGVATVTTYIAKNLTNVKFFYEDTEFTKVNSTEALGVNKFYYEGSSGKLVFMTSHFSEFYVTSTDEAFNATQGKAFEFFRDATDDLYYEDGDVVVLLRDINVNALNNDTDISKSITIDGNGKTISCSGGIEKSYYVLNFYNDSDTTVCEWNLKNLTIECENTQTCVCTDGDNPSNRSILEMSDVVMVSQGECVYANGFTIVNAKDCTMTRTGNYGPANPSGIGGDLGLAAVMVGYSGICNLDDCVISSDCNGITTFPTGSEINIRNCTISVENAQSYLPSTSYGYGYALYSECDDYSAWYASSSTINMYTGNVSGGVRVQYSNSGNGKTSSILIKAGVILNNQTVNSDISFQAPSPGSYVLNNDNEFIPLNN